MPEGGNVSTPDVTPAQIVAVLTALVTAAVTLFKLDLSDEQRAAIVTALTALVTVGWVIADALIRRGRAKIEVAKVQAEADKTTAVIYQNSATPVGAAPTVAAQRDAP